ncbi:TPA: replication-associated recombination protein A [Clostridioides difficile]|uniref:Recombination factor protein RarA n=1 Tax=Clostridioides difficile ATCC 9689 = DSM 1296 TaxID=1121308 RepID=A0AC59FXX4_CLODI|nr:replication-associated recombination protein A [Clostridioides difficile]AKP42219.1 recombination factor protein RarA [Clostridioides difficile ATCC 9689 = DSM 1296]ARC14191.1 replication-associated recombination protein A [Clostridioides difficile]AVI11805.1 replication-associated recombination protein A [Clostridioides difficile]AXU86163.1 recombination factor protein RarA [Clostridioides difficile]EGT3642494.1 replication-associated recombination protein A [Clostridioides difficile]
MPLADKIRPKTMNDVIGQSHIIGNGKILSKILQSNFLPNMIFFGPPGVGKTTVAEIIAERSNKSFYKINATNSSLEDIKKVISELGSINNVNGVLLYIDEIQSFNKKQQQSILEFMENGSITLIASTTENPYHYVYKALLSRSTVFEFKPLEKLDIEKGLKRAVEVLNEDSYMDIECNNNAIEDIAILSDGDMRRALNILEVVVYSTKPNKDNITYIDSDVIRASTFNKIINYDKNGDSHYDILSAFQKSIRGSDPQASIHYLARLIKGGDLISICRRLLVIASEDIGLAYPNAIVIVKACVDSAMQLGFPEAKIPLAEATILLATSPKSNSACIAIMKAMDELDKEFVKDIPNSIKDAHYSGSKEIGRGCGYKYPHNFKNHYVKQQYLPDSIKDSIYYIPQENKTEKNIKKYLEYLNGDF